MTKTKTTLLAFLICLLSLFVVSANKTYAGELKYVAMEQTSNNLFLADRDQGRIYVFNNDGKGTFNKTITVGSSPTSMVIYDKYLLVALSQAKKIKIIDTTNLTEAGEISTPKMPYWLALDGDRLHSTVSKNNGTDYYPFVINLFTSNNTVVASTTTIWPTTYPNFYMRGNEHIIVSPTTHAAYIGNLGYSPDNIKKYDTTDISNIQYLMQNDHGSLGSNGQQFIFNENYLKIYFSASGVSGYVMQIVNPDNLSKIATLSLGAYPNSVAYDSSYIYAGKSAYYDDGDIKVYNKNTNVFVKDYNLPDYENLISRGISSGANLYAASNKFLYLLDTNSSSVTKIYDFVNDEIVDNTPKDGDLIKMEGLDTIYQLNSGKRNVIPYISGYEDYKNAVMDSRGLNEDDAKIIQQSELESYPLGKNITIKPNTKYLLKQQDQEKYFIITSEAEATEVNKSSYSHYSLVLIPNAFLSNYTINESDFKPDFIINDIIYYKNYSGEENVVSAKVCNNGGSHTFDSSGLKVEFGLNGNYTNWVKNNGGETMNNGDCKEFFPGLKIINGTGTFNISVRIDGENQIPESNENNNTFSKNVIVSTNNETQLPDLVIYGVHLPSANNKNFTVQVQNTGSVSTSFKDGVKVSASVINAKNSLVSLDSSYYYLDNLGSREMKSTTFTIKGDLTEKMQLKIWIDNAENGGSGFIEESNENNNSLIKEITIKLPNNNTDEENIKYGDGTYDLDVGDKVVLDNGAKAVIDYAYNNYGEAGTDNFAFSEIRFDLYDPNDLYVSKTEWMRVGNEKEFEIFQQSGTVKGVKILFHSSGGGCTSQAVRCNKVSLESISIEAEEDDDDNNDEKTEDDQIDNIYDRAKNLFQNKLDQILVEVQELRDIVKEQQTQIKYLATLKKDVDNLSEKVENALNNFITYGVDDNTKKLGAGERAAVIYSYKSAFSKLPETEEELADAIKIANGRWPSITNDEAEKRAKEQFQKIYKRIADMNNASDNAAVTVMAYGLRQKAENRNLESEKSGINTFKNIYGYHPDSTEDWNIMQAITYSGATRGIDTDGDLLTDEREAELGTDPNNKDSDGDGYLDGVEVANGFDPLK